MKYKSLFIYSLLTVLIFSVLAFGADGPVPKAKKKRKSHKTTTAKIKTPVVQKLDMEGLKKVLQRDANNPRPLLVNFWATWCDPCREEFPDLIKIDKEYREKGLDFIIISLDDLEDINTKVPMFLKEMKSTMPAYLLYVEDQSEAIASVSSDWGGGLPATFLFNVNREIVYSRTGIIKPDDLKNAINKVLPNK